MSFESFKRENRYTKEEKDKSKMSRRDFLKKAAILTGGILLSDSLLKLMKDETGEDRKLEEKDEEKRSVLDGATEEQKQIEEEDMASLSEILDYEKEDIELNERSIEAIKNHWKRRYTEEPNLGNSLKSAYYNMGEWMPYLKEQFKKHKVPEKYVYLAIPESHWQTDAVSSRNAVGPYQFTAATARSYGLKTEYFIDDPKNLEERKDPIKSADACAELLKDLYNASGDWSLALSGYNGGYFWRYLKHARKKNEEISYSGFLKYMESKIKMIKDEVRSKNIHEHKVNKGESMSAISRKYNISVDRICEINSIEDESKIYVGQSINIPVSDRDRRSIFENRIKGMVENLNYPSKFNAVHELIEEGFVKEQKEPVTFQTNKVTSLQQSYIFKKEDINIYQLSLKFQGLSGEDILKANPHIDPFDLKGGEELIIPNNNSGSTLHEIAEKRGVSLLMLQKLNPAIKDPNKVIPREYEVRG